MSYLCLNTNVISLFNLIILIVSFIIIIIIIILFYLLYFVYRDIFVFFYLSYYFYLCILFIVFLSLFFVVCWAQGPFLFGFKFWPKMAQDKAHNSKPAAQAAVGPVARHSVGPGLPSLLAGAPQACSFFLVRTTSPRITCCFFSFLSA